MRDPLSPDPPRPACFDAARGAWTLSRYADVVAAFSEPALAPSEAMESARLREEARSAFPAGKLDRWRVALEPLATEMMESILRNRVVDLAGEFLRPWSRKLAALATGAAGDERLDHLARKVSAAAADPEDDVVRRRAETANVELERAFTDRGKAAAFVALSQTLPALLASAWLALLRHPGEIAKLAADPALMPAALDELLRYAGFPRTLLRTARDAFAFGGVAISSGDRVILEIASANRDPSRFPDPDCLDLSRPALGQLALGAGTRSCPGGPLIRMAMAVATSAFASGIPRARLVSEVEWKGGAGFRYPAALWVSRLSG